MGIAIRRLTNSQRHTGFVYSWESKPRLAHLDLTELRDESLPVADGYLLGKLPLNPRIARALSVLCRRVIEHQQEAEVPHLPLGFRYTGSTFGLDGRLILAGDDQGLLCATFVIALCKSSGVELLRLEEWECRPEDQNWRRELLIGALDHLDEADRERLVMERDEEMPRFRPEEVAAAACIDALPLTYEAGRSLGEAIVARLARP